MATIRCPHCGSPVMIRGNRWKCGWCGDFGVISSLHHAEKTKLMQSATPSISFTITVTDTSDDEEKTPRSFSRSELETMVSRWDFSENERACRDLLIAAFPELTSHWTAEELEVMDDTKSLLLEVSDQDPNIAIDMVALLLNTAGKKLKHPAVAQQLLGRDIEDTLLDFFVQEPLLPRLKTNNCLAKQLFQSAYTGTIQKDLLEACDTFEEPTLKEYLYSLLVQNPYFNKCD